jgi:L-rhamnose mutarotase
MKKTISTLKVIIKALFTLIAAALTAITVFALIIFCIAKCNKGAPVPTDTEMIAHFQRHETVFGELCFMIEKDSLSHIPLFIQEKEQGMVLLISAEREFEYDSLMDKIQITSIWNSSPFQRETKNSILFYYFTKGDATWGIEKGFEYVFDRTKEDDKEFTEKELHDLAIERYENCELYKKINDNWNLFIIYDR